MPPFDLNIGMKEVEKLINTKPTKVLEFGMSSTFETLTKEEQDKYAKSAVASIYYKRKHSDTRIKMMVQNTDTLDKLKDACRSGDYEKAYSYLCQYEKMNKLLKVF